MDDHERKLREAARLRIAQVFNVPSDLLASGAQFGVELKSSFVSDFRANEYDQIHNDIRDVADRQILKDLGSGALVIRTVGEYCDHMVRCYRSKPDEVNRILKLEQTT
jgi:hypothetical protein